MTHWIAAGFSAVLQLLHAISWPIAIIAIAFGFRKTLRRLFNRSASVKLGTTGIELILEKLEQSGFAREELQGLSGNEIWALNTIATTAPTRKGCQSGT